MILFLMLRYRHRHFVVGSAPQPSIPSFPIPRDKGADRAVLTFCPFAVWPTFAAAFAFAARSWISLSLCCCVAALSPFLSPSFAQVRFAIKTGLGILTTAVRQCVEFATRATTWRCAEARQQALAGAASSGQAQE